MAGTDIPGPYKSIAASFDVMWLPKMCFLLEPVLGKQCKTFTVQCKSFTVHKAHIGPLMSMGLAPYKSSISEKKNGRESHSNPKTDRNKICFQDS